MPEITYKEVAVKSTVEQDGKKVRAEVDRVKIPLYPTLELMVEKLGEKEVLDLANRQHATDIKNEARAAATRDYSEAGWEKLARQKFSDPTSPEFMALAQEAQIITSDSSLTPAARKAALEALGQSHVRKVIEALKSRKISREFEDDNDDEDTAA